MAVSSATFICIPDLCFSLLFFCFIFFLHCIVSLACLHVSSNLQIACLHVKPSKCFRVWDFMLLLNNDYGLVKFWMVPTSKIWLSFSGFENYYFIWFLNGLGLLILLPTRVHWTESLLCVGVELSSLFISYHIVSH